jgi:hypothetical protein
MGQESGDIEIEVINNTSNDLDSILAWTLMNKVGVLSWIDLSWTFSLNKYHF